MSEISTKDHWNTRYSEGGNSGYGSYGEQANLKLTILKKNLKDIKSITDIGCGDFAFSKRVCDLFPKATYKGFDVSDYIVDLNKRFFPNYSFEVAQKTYPKADVILCIDVLFHVITPKEREELLHALNDCWSKYLVVTELLEREEELLSLFGKPLIKECIEGETGFLYIWKK